MNKEICMKEAEESILHTYNRFPVVFDHGEGVYLYDTDGKEYLDFAAGIFAAFKAPSIASVPLFVKTRQPTNSFRACVHSATSMTFC